MSTLWLKLAIRYKCEDCVGKSKLTKIRRSFLMTAIQKSIALPKVSSQGELIADYVKFPDGM
jgi:hypothetical protein